MEYIDSCNIGISYEDKRLKYVNIKKSPKFKIGDCVKIKNTVCSRGSVESILICLEKGIYIYHVILGQESKLVVEHCLDSNEPATFEDSSIPEKS